MKIKKIIVIVYFIFYIVLNFFCILGTKMEIFKTDILKKEFEIFQKEVLIDALECGLCEKTAYESWHKKFLVSCKYCRGNACKA